MSTIFGPFTVLINVKIPTIVRLFIMLINVKMPTIVRILTFTSIIVYVIIILVEHDIFL